MGARGIGVGLAVGLLLILQVGLPVAEASGSLQVTVTTYSGSAISYQDYIVISATVTSGGTPVPNVLVTFSDSFKFQFHGSAATTDNNGVALTEMQLNSGTSGTDTITASVTVSGQSASGQTTVNVLPYGATQLWVTASIYNSGAIGGSSAVIYGTVDAYSFGVSGATVTVSDTIGSTFPSQKIFSGAGGSYSLNFTLGNPSSSVTDLITLTANAAGYSGSSTTMEVAVYPYNSNSLTVNLNAIYPSSYSTYLNHAVVQAKVSAGGLPVSGAKVVFSDSLGQTFQGATATTDAQGVATTVVYYGSGNNGMDIFTAQASASGFNSGIGSNMYSIFAYGNTQLYISEALGTTTPSAGTLDSVSGQVGYYNGESVSRATVTISDSANSFAPLTVFTNNSGLYKASFSVPNIGLGCVDVIEVSTMYPGYSGSTSALFLVVTSGSSTCSSPSSSSSTKTITVTSTHTVYNQTANGSTTTTITVTNTSTVYNQAANGSTTTQTVTQPIYQTTTSTVFTGVTSTVTSGTIQLVTVSTTVTSSISQTQTAFLNQTSALAVAVGMILASGVAVAVVRRRK